MLQSLRHRRKSAADGRQKQGIEPLITEPADHRNQASGEFYFGTFGESSNGVDTSGPAAVQGLDRQRAPVAAARGAAYLRDDGDVSGDVRSAEPAGSAGIGNCRAVQSC